MGTEELLLENIKNLMEEKKISQQSFLERCSEKGIVLSQSTLSKILSGKRNLTVEHLDIFSRILEVPISIFFESVNETILMREDSHGFWVECHDVSESAFKGYLGRFCLYFFSPAATEAGKILEGELELREKENICDVTMRIFFDSQSGSPSQRGTKEYRGQMVISKNMGSAYIVLMNQDLGDMGAITFRHRKFRMGQLEVRLGLALTTSAGDFNLATSHYVLLSRESMSSEKLAMLANVYMRVGTHHFYLKGSDLERLREEFPEDRDIFDKWEQIGTDCCGLDLNQLENLVNSSCQEESRRFPLISGIISLASGDTYNETIDIAKEKKLYTSLEVKKT